MGDFNLNNPFYRAGQKAVLACFSGWLLFEVYYFKNIHWFQTDLQQVCGFLQRTNELNQKLVSAERINDLLQASNNKKYRKELMAELGIA